MLCMVKTPGAPAAKVLWKKGSKTVVIVAWPSPSDIFSEPTTRHDVGHTRGHPVKSTMSDGLSGAAASFHFHDGLSERTHGLGKIEMGRRNALHHGGHGSENDPVDIFQGDARIFEGCRHSFSHKIGIAHVRPSSVFGLASPYNCNCFSHVDYLLLS